MNYYLFVAIGILTILVCFFIGYYFGEKEEHEETRDRLRKALLEIDKLCDYAVIKANMEGFDQSIYEIVKEKTEKVFTEVEEIMPNGIPAHAYLYFKDRLSNTIRNQFHPNSYSWDKSLLKETAIKTLKLKERKCQKKSKKS